MNTPTKRPSFWNQVGVVARREVTTRFLSKSFLISTIITLALILVAMVLGPRIGDLVSGGSSTVAVTPQTAAVVEQLDVEVKEVPDEAAAKKAVESEEADAAIVEDPNSPTGFSIIALRSAPSTLVQDLSVAPPVQLLDPDAPNGVLLYMLGLGFGLLWLMAAMTFGMSIGQSVVEEKETRIVEILLATVSARALLTGKILGNSAAALVQIALYVATAGIGMAINGSVLPASQLAAPIAWFVVLFLFGFLMIAALYAAAASLVSRQEDLQSSAQPLIWLIMLPYMAVIFLNDNPTAMQIMSYIPFSAPVAVPIRVFTGLTEWWEPWLALGILVATTAAIIAFAAKVYENGLLRTGKRLKWKQALTAEK